MWLSSLFARSPFRLAPRRRKPVVGRLAIEVLEDHWCPSCTVVQDGNALFITGDRGDNHIDIVQVGDPSIRVACDGGPARTFVDIARIVIDTGAGNDQVSGLVSHYDDIVAALGAGNDSVNMTIQAPPQPDETEAAMRLTLLGEGGNDQIIVAMDNPVLSGDTEPAPRRPLAMTLDGGRGNDVLRVTVGDPQIMGPPQVLNGDLSARLVGGDGLDSSVIIHWNVAVTGVLSESIELGAGDDEANLRQFQVTGNVTTSVDGGFGNDHMTEIANACSGNWTSTSRGGPGADVVVADVNDFTGTLAWTIDGGDGMDNIAARVGFNPQPDPPGAPALRSLQLNVDGGAKADAIEVQVDLAHQQLASADVKVLGGLGDDRLALGIVNVGDPQIVDGLVDGGDGFDTARAADGVIFRNVEAVS